MGVRCNFFVSNELRFKVAAGTALELSWYSPTSKLL